jgi:NAD(P)-dependent dehydrogenase (short-subunit alcohol dehydrogenase family)
VHPADVTDAPALRAAIASAAQSAGAIDILVNNAGAIDTRPFVEVSAELWAGLLAVNLTAAFTAAQAVLPAMLTAGWGRIVNIASTAGLTGYPYVAPYCAAKHGLVGMTRALALEVARKGITVNAVCPGYTDTDMFSQAAALVAERTGRSQDEARARLAANCPTGRIVQPEEVAATVAWLCGPDTGAITGQAISISGGEVMP